MLNSNLKLRPFMKAVALVVTLATLVSGCATTKRMDFQDLNYYKIDCANKEAQIRFLETQLSTPNERVVAKFTGGLLSVLDGTYHEKERIVNRSYDAVARGLLWDIRTYCP
jgi:hypothetical protein